MKKNAINYKWIIKISIFSFLISIGFSFISETTIPNLNIFFGILISLIFIGIGILFDMVGVSVTESKESTFNSMAAQKVKGAQMAVKLKKNADKVSSFCNDVVGDICGIVSGATGTAISIKISSLTNWNILIVMIIVMGIISTLTISGKAMVKGIAIKKSDNILFKFAKVLSLFTKN